MHVSCAVRRMVINSGDGLHCCNSFGQFIPFDFRREHKTTENDAIETNETPSASQQEANHFINTRFLFLVSWFEFFSIQ